MRASAEAGDRPDVDWAAVRRAYEETSEPVSSIRSRFGLTEWPLRKVREGELWMSRPAAARPGLLQGAKLSVVDRLVVRLSKIADAASLKLERRLGTDTFEEGDARALKELGRAADIMKRIERTDKAAKAREKKNNNDGRDGSDLAASRRAELIRRVECLRKAHGFQLDPGASS